MSEPTRWEYATVPLLTHATKQILDQWGEDGWELVRCCQGRPASSTSHTSSGRNERRIHWSARLAEQGIELPPVVKPVAAYVPAVHTGDLVYTGPVPDAGRPAAASGQVR